jgi:hypothetical protein
MNGYEVALPGPIHRVIDEDRFNDPEAEIRHLLAGGGLKGPIQDALGPELDPRRSRPSKHFGEVTT